MSYETLKLVRAFISSNLALKNMFTREMIDCLDPAIRVFSYKTVRYRILVEVFEKLLLKLNQKCQDSQSITLIPDCWSSFNGTSYMGKN